MFDLKTAACSNKVQYGEKIPVKAVDMPSICTHTTFPPISSNSEGLDCGHSRQIFILKNCCACMTQCLARALMLATVVKRTILMALDQVLRKTDIFEV